MKIKKKLKSGDWFASRLKKGNWWERGNECLNMHDINKPPKYYTGTWKMWIEELTTYIYLYPAEWESIYEQYQEMSKNGSDLEFYRNEEGYLRKVGLDEVYLKVTGLYEPLSHEVLKQVGWMLLEQPEKLFCSYLEYSRKDEEDKAHWVEYREEEIKKRLKRPVFVKLAETLDESDFAGDELYFDILNDLYIIL